jgi:hypothetical protein
VFDQIEILDVRNLADRLDERERTVIPGRSAQTFSEIGAGWAR